MLTFPHPKEFVAIDGALNGTICIRFGPFRGQRNYGNLKQLAITEANIKNEIK